MVYHELEQVIGPAKLSKNGAQERVVYPMCQNLKFFFLRTDVVSEYTMYFQNGTTSFLSALVTNHISPITPINFLLAHLGPHTYLTNSEEHRKTLNWRIYADKMFQGLTILLDICFDILGSCLTFLQQVQIVDLADQS